MTRDDVIRMAREAGFQTGTRDYADGNGGMPFVTPIATGTCLPELERFAALVASHVHTLCTPAIVVETTGLEDPATLRDMLSKAPPMPILQMPPTADAISAAVAAERQKQQADIERWKAEAATAEKWRGIACAKHGDGRTVQIIQQEAAAAEREACALVCEAKDTGRRLTTDYKVLECASAIRARGAA